MPRTVVVATRFKRDLKRVQKRGQDLNILKQVVELLETDRALPAKHKDHKLVSNWVGRRECHLQPDWLLIYQLPDENTLVLERTGSHSDLFK